MDTSQLKKDRGTLFMLSNHIGNERDIPARSLIALTTADLLVFEEDRPARLALKAAKVHREYLKFSEHIQKETLEQVYNYLKKGKSVAYMSDQGCPSLADPGRSILQVAYQLNAPIRVIPGPSSVTAAISACPFDLSSYFYAGFLPRQSDKRMAKIKQYASMGQALIVLDTPYRLKALLSACKDIFPKKRAGFLAVDVTGEDEVYFCAPLEALEIQAKHLSHKKLNFVLIIDGVGNRVESKKTHR
ncbi:MAG: SAM-dependent methyltransferase [Oligoflexales bacterium]